MPRSRSSRVSNAVTNTTGVLRYETAPTTTKTTSARPNPTLILVPTFHFIVIGLVDGLYSGGHFVMHDNLRVCQDAGQVEHDQAFGRDAFQVVAADVGERR